MVHCEQECRASADPIQEPAAGESSRLPFSIFYAVRMRRDRALGIGFYHVTRQPIYRALKAETA